MVSLEEIKKGLETVKAMGTGSSITFSHEEAAVLLSALFSPPPSIDEETEAGEIDRLRKQVAGCTWYWPEDDTSSDTCQDSPWEILQEYSNRSGRVIAISRGGVVETRYYASLPPADDSDSDDDFEVDESSEAEAEAKIKAELDRRDRLSSHTQTDVNIPFEAASPEEERNVKTKT